MDDEDRLLLTEAALERTKARIGQLGEVLGVGSPMLTSWIQETIAALEAVRAVRKGRRDIDVAEQD